MNPEDLLLAVLGAKLTPLQRDVLLDLTLRDGLYPRDLAVEYGVSRQRISQVWCAARRKIVKSLAEAA